MRASAPTRPLVAACAAALLLVASGCTICPDPYDYSGPVPNGSPPQNDFRARSGGIIPLGGVSRPWPPVVQAGPDHDEPPQLAMPAAAEQPVPVAADPGAGDRDDAPRTADPGVQPVAVEATRETTTDAIEADPPGVLESSDAPEAEMLLPPVAPRPEVTAPLRETPGWRPRG